MAISKEDKTNENEGMLLLRLRADFRLFKHNFENCLAVVDQIMFAYWQLLTVD